MEDKGLQSEGENLFRSAEFRNSVESLKENYNTYLQHIVIMSNLRMARYKALLNAGFEKELAEKIILQVGLLE